jgi:PAS domain S-box-containing protein
VGRFVPDGSIGNEASFLKTDATDRLPGLRWLVLLSAILTVAAAAGSAKLYLYGSQRLQVHAREVMDQTAADPASPASRSMNNLLAQAQSWALQASAATAVGGTGMMGVVLLGFTWWRRSVLNRLAEASQLWAEHAQKLEESEAAAQRLSAEKTKLETEVRKTQAELEQRVQQRTAALSANCATLQEELDSRKRAEKALAMQAKELERSKDVLEMHVQARTQELQKLKTRYEYILNSAGEGIYGLDTKGRTTFVNPAAAKLTGWKVEELVGKLENEVFHSREGEGNTAFRNRDGAQLNEQLFSRKDGTNFPVEYVRTQIQEKDKVVGAVVIFKDITERKRAEETLARKAAELARSNAELEQFAYVASHDLQEPLRKIQAFGDRLKSKLDAVQLSDGRDFLERMQNAAARMQTLINDLLTFSRVISASQPFVPVDLGAVTREVLGDLEVRIERTKARVEVGALPTIDADPLQMRQLLQNLIGNALKFQPPDQQPVVTISAEIIKTPLAGSPEAGPLDEVCQLTVQDNGIGFEEKYLEKIFAVFQRLHGRAEYEGTGVGLAVCRRITDRHGGTITATSQPGAGARFIVMLPVHQPRKETPA